MKQSANAGDNSIIVQAGRDAILQMQQCPPVIRLVRLTIAADDQEGGTRQRMQLIVKNNGDITAVLQKGSILCDAHENVTMCNHIGMKYCLITSDWSYDVDIESDSREFVGRHSIAPAEVVSFDIVIGRSSRLHTITVYRCRLQLDFDEGGSLVTEPFFIELYGPTIWAGGYMARGPSPKQWGECQADNIRRLDRIGFDYRSKIDADSVQYVKAVAPELFKS